MYYQFVEDLLANKHLLSIKNAVKKITIPQLIIHGANDTTVLVDEAHQLKLWNPNSKMYLIEGAEHTFGGKHPFDSENLPKHTLELLQITMDFFKNKNQ
jgi:pimeloyl-ACP methyl ester carboxylesterase